MKRPDQQYVRYLAQAPKESPMIEKRDSGLWPAVWQEQDGWHVRVRHGGAVRIFATRDEAISYSTSTFTDGATAAQAETQRGDVVPTVAPAAAQSPKNSPESGGESYP
jgi:hypothetical protein